MVDSDPKRRKVENGDSLPELDLTNRVPTVKDLMFGASGLGCLYVDVPPEQATATMETVIQAGIDYFDTAPWYGAGLSESRVGEFLKAGDGVKLSTKCGRHVKPLAEVDDAKERVERNYIGHFITDKYHKNIPVADYTAEGIKKSFQQSAERLQRKKIDCLRLHDAENPERWAEATDGGGVDAMIQLRKEGLIGEISLGLNRADYILKYLQKYPKGTFDNVMVAGAWNLIDQDGMELLQECQKLGVKVHNVGIFASGVLWGSSHYKYGDIPAEVAKKVESWETLAVKHGLTLPQLALNFALLPTCVERVAFGCKKPEQVGNNVALCGKQVPLELWAEAKQMGLILEKVPLPLT